MQQANYHAHSHFSDGQHSPEVYLSNAISQGLKAYGFSDHAPILLEGFGMMSMDKLNDYLHEISRLQDEYGQRIQIYKGLEVDYIPNVINVNSPHIVAANLDYTIGAVHYVDYFEDGRPWGFEGADKNFQKGLNEIFKGDIRACVHRYYSLIREMVTQHCPDVVAHLDRIKKLNFDEKYFSEKEEWYREEVIKTLEIIAQSEAIMEINTKGYYKGETLDTYPGKWVLEIAHEMGIPIHLSSDAHHPDDITKGFDYGIEMMKNIGISFSKIFLYNEWLDDSIEYQNWEMSDLI